MKAPGGFSDIERLSSTTKFAVTCFGWFAQGASVVGELLKESIDATFSLPTGFDNRLRTKTDARARPHSRPSSAHVVQRIGLVAGFEIIGILLGCGP